MHPSLSQANAPALFTLCHSSMLDLGWPWQGKGLGHGVQRWPSPGAQVGTWQSLLALKQCIRSLIVAVPHENPHGPILLITHSVMSVTHKRGGGRAALGLVIGHLRAKGTCTWGYVWAEQGKQLWVSAREFHQRQLRPLSVVDRSQELTWAPPPTPNALSSAFSTCGAKVQVLGMWKTHT